MVGREQREHALLQALPARLLAGLVARRRRADIFRALHVEPLESSRSGPDIADRSRRRSSAPAVCARRISSIASRLETCTITIGTSISSASEIARWVASRSTGIGRDVAWIIRRGLAGALQPVGQETDRVIVLGMDHDERAGLARDPSTPRIS